MKDRMQIPKLFYAIPSKYPDWPWKDRRAVGYDLDKSWSRNEPIYRFQHKDTLYEISPQKARLVGRKYQVPGGICPHLLPVAVMDRVVSLNAKKVNKNKLF